MAPTNTKRLADLLVAAEGVATDANGILKVDATTVTNTSGTGTQANVASSAASVTVLAANTNRRGATVYNDSTQVLYLLLSTGGTASATVYTIQMAAQSYYEVPFSYTGALIGIWAAANGSARVMEFTA